jgi:hypothetical protein
MPTARRGDWTPSLRAPSYSVSTDAKPHAGFGLGLHNMQVKAQPTPLCDRTRTGWLLGCLTSHNQQIFTCSLQAAARGKLPPQSGTTGLRESEQSVDLAHPAADLMAVSIPATVGEHPRTGCRTPICAAAAVGLGMHAASGRVACPSHTRPDTSPPKLKDS